METRITIRRCSEGVLTQLSTEHVKASKTYTTWQEALSDARELGLLSEVLIRAAGVLPPDRPFEVTADVNPSAFGARGFIMCRVD